MKMTIYVPDSLAERLKSNSQINVSATCQTALREAVAEAEGEPISVDAMPRVVLDAYNPDDCSDMENGPWEPVIWTKVAFVGRRIARVRGSVSWDVYLTSRGCLVAHDVEARHYWAYRSLPELGHFTDNLGTEEERSNLQSQMRVALQAGMIQELDI